MHSQGTQMKLKLRIPLFITLVVASVGIGTVGVHASTDCQHLFRAYQNQVAKHLHHKVSPETLARWAAWNKAHPHYHPTQKESMDKIDFVCEVPMDDAGISDGSAAGGAASIADFDDGYFFGSVSTEYHREQSCAAG